MVARKVLPATGFWARSTSTAQWPYLQLLPGPGQGHDVTAQDDTSTAWAFWNLLSAGPGLTSAPVSTGPVPLGLVARVGLVWPTRCSAFSHIWDQGKHLRRTLQFTTPLPQGGTVVPGPPPQQASRPVSVLSVPCESKGVSPAHLPSLEHGMRPTAPELRLSAGLSLSHQPSSPPPCSTTGSDTRQASWLCVWWKGPGPLLSGKMDVHCKGTARHLG